MLSNLRKAVLKVPWPGNSLEFFRAYDLRNISRRLLLKLSGETVMLWFSVPQMQSPGNIRIAVQKNSRQVPRKTLCFCASWQIVSLKFSQIFQSSWFKEHLQTAATRRFFVPWNQSPESITKVALENLRKFLKKTSVGIHIFLILGNKTTLSLMVSWEFCKMF